MEGCFETRGVRAEEMSLETSHCKGGKVSYSYTMLGMKGGTYVFIVYKDDNDGISSHLLNSV
jgi:hypothetical protein